ncbi:MAG: hypothetical protein AAF542_05760 [Pseudomonadota bacterium]
MLTSYVGRRGANVRFYRQCESTLCSVVDGEMHGITSGCLNEDQGIELTCHVFVASKAGWVSIANGVPQFTKHATFDAANSESVPKI